MKFNNSSIFRSALLFLILGSILLSYIAALSMETEALQRVDSNIQVLQIPSEVEGKDILQEINNFSIQSDETIYAEVFTPEARQIYVAEGGEGSRWIEKGYPSLAPWNKIETSSLLHIPHFDARQLFFFSGGREAEENLREILDELGIAYRVYPGDEMGFLFGIDSFSYTAFLLVILLISLIYFGVVLNAHPRRLWGGYIFPTGQNDAYLLLTCETAILFFTTISLLRNRIDFTIRKVIYRRRFNPS